MNRQEIFEDFRDNYCDHQRAYLRFEGDEEAVKACSYKNECPSRSWTDWQKCTLENCPFFRHYNVGPAGSFADQDTLMPAT